MENNIVLTIAIPTYNRCEILRKTIESIINQKTDDIEILISDNASTDNTENMLKQYPDIKYYRNESNIGAEANFIKCYERAKGQYVMLFGSDDIMLEGKLKYIMAFLKQNELDWIIVNHCFFKKNFTEDNKKKTFMNVSRNLITTNKKKFMKYVQYQISFQSCQILNKKTFNRVVNPEKYSKTYFLHCSIAMEGTKNNDAKLGIIGENCIAANISGSDSTLQSVKIFEVFGKWENYVFVNHGALCGYNKRQMKKIHAKFSRKTFPFLIIKLKANGVHEWKTAFYEYCYPYIKAYPSTWITTMPAAFLPTKICEFIYCKLRPIIRG